MRLNTVGIGRHGWRLAILATAFTVHSAWADVGPYVGIEGGWTHPLNTPAKYNDGFVEGATLGYALPGHLRPEFEVDYRRNNVHGEDAATSNISMMGNLWYDFETPSNYFYFGAGIGENHLKSTLGQASDTADAFAYQFGIGAGYKLSHQLLIGVDYRYLATATRSTFTFGALQVKGHLHSQAVMIGLRYNFGGYWDPLAPERSERAVRVVPLSSGD